MCLLLRTSTHHMPSRVGGVCSLAGHREHITVNREHTVDTIQQHVPRLRGGRMRLKGVVCLGYRNLRFHQLD